MPFRAKRFHRLQLSMASSCMNTRSRPLAPHDLITGTPSEGGIFLLFEGGPAGHYSAIQVVAFNLR